MINDVSYIPTAWIDDITNMKADALGLACVLIAKKGASEVTIKQLVASSRARTRTKIINSLNALAKFQITERQKDGSWIFRAPQPEGEMVIRIIND